MFLYTIIVHFVNANKLLLWLLIPRKKEGKGYKKRNVRSNDLSYAMIGEWYLVISKYIILDSSVGWEGDWEFMF